MRVQVVDPGGYVRPYDHALCRALASEGLDVELLTTPIGYGAPPEPAGYTVDARFHRRSAQLDRGPRQLRRVARTAEHVADMTRHRRRPGAADVRHYQWLPLEPLDVTMLPRSAPRVLTMHNVVRRGTRRDRLALIRWVANRMDAVIVHSRDSARRLGDAGVDAGRIHVIPHGPFDYLTELTPRALPDELAAVDRPVVLAFGMVRDYKGVDLLIEALADVPDAELWVVGMPLRTSMEPLHRLAARVPGRVRFVTRFVDEDEIAAFFERADVVALPYRRIDQSGVLFTALAFAKPLVLSAVGGFVEIAEEHHAARLVPPGDVAALGAAIRDLIDDAEERERLSSAARSAAEGPFAWQTIASRTAALYRSL